MYITTDDGIHLFVEVRGRGVPCIFLHGGPGYWSKSFSETGGSLLESNVEMIYIDQRGCGRSFGHAEDFSLSRLLKDIENVRSALNIRECYILGHSFGGILAVNYAYQYSPFIKGILLSNATLNMSASFAHQIKKGNELLKRKPEDIEHQYLMNNYFAMQKELLDRNLYFSLQYKYVKNKAKLDEIDKELRPEPFFQQYVFTNKEYFEDFTEMTNEIGKPALIISGKYDHAVGPDHHCTFQFKKAEHHVLGSGHHPYIECPCEFKQAVLQFLKQK